MTLDREQTPEEVAKLSPIAKLSTRAKLALQQMGDDGYISQYPGMIYHIWLSDEAEARHLRGESGGVGLHPSRYVSRGTMKELERAGLVYFDWHTAKWRRPVIEESE